MPCAAAASSCAGRWLKVASLIVAGGAARARAGPLLGALLILVTNAPFWLVNVVAGVVYAVAMPFVALATAYAYFDARVREELEGAARSGGAACRDRALRLSMAEPDRPDRHETPLEIDRTSRPRTARDLARADPGCARQARSRARRHASVDVGFNVVEHDAVDRRRAARRRARVPPLRPPAADRAAVRLRPRALRGRGGQEHREGRQGRRAARADRVAGRDDRRAATHAGRSSSLMIPAVLYAAAKLYRAIAIMHALAWHGSGRGARMTPRGVGMLLVALIFRRASPSELVRLGPAAQRPVRRAGRADRLPRRSSAAAGSSSDAQLPHRDVGWTALLPGAALVGAGLLFVNVFNVYVTTRLVEDQANTYGALGIAAALLFSLVLVGRVIVASAVLNALVARHRAAQS